MKVSACLVTRGDVNLDSIVGSLPREWERIFWSNGEGRCYVLAPDADPSQDETWTNWHEVEDLAVYGRYAAIEYASGDLIYVQDDDCVVSDPQAIVDTWLYGANFREGSLEPLPNEPQWSHGSHVVARDHIVCNMPANFRARHFYDEHSLVGFGAAFHRDAPKRAFERWADYVWTQDGSAPPELQPHGEFFHRTCDIVFTGLTPRVLVDIEYVDMPWASADNRMWKQPWHQQVRNEMLDLVLKVRGK